MTDKVVPMIHVPDVKATVDWYRDIGFTVNATYNNEGEGLSFAVVSFGGNEVMFNQGGRPSSQKRREVDLYVYTDHVDDLYGRLKDQVDVVEGPHDTFYGMRELIIRDLNRFWITFGQESVFALLMTSVRDGKTELVGRALDSGKVKSETLSVALAAASEGDNKNSEIVEMLRKAGALPAPQVNMATLLSYVGKYKGIRGLEVEVTIEAGKLFANLAGQQQLSLWPIDQTTFRPIAFDDMTITFNVESGKTTGFGFKQGTETMQLTLIAVNSDE